METIFERIMLVEIETPRRRMEAITDLSTSLYRWLPNKRKILLD